MMIIGLLYGGGIKKSKEKVQEDGNIIGIVLDIRGNMVSTKEIKKKMNLKVYYFLYCVINTRTPQATTAPSS